MSTTLTALRAGSVSYAYTVAIEGYPHLLTSGDPNAALLAWTEGATITKTSASDAWNAGASSVESASGDCYVQFKATAGADRAIGFATVNTNDHSTAASIFAVNFTIYLAPTLELKVLEVGAATPFTGGTWAVDDLLGVRRTGSVITYDKNGTVFYTSLTASTGPLYVSADLYDGSTALSYITFEDAGATTPLTWTGESNVTIAAASGTDWESCLGGLFVDAQHDQHINPWEPFNSGGKCAFTIAQTTTGDTFGVDTHRKGGADETILTAELDRNETTVTVKSTSLFDSSGTIHIGTECIGYTGTTATTFTGCTRGKYSPFAATGSEVSRFGNYHRVGFDAQSVKLQPGVSSIPKSWSGRRIGIWIHRVVADVLDTQAQAHLVYAGRIVDVRDSAGSLGTVVECEHILDEVREGAIGTNLWSAKVKPGMYLSTGMTFLMNDSRDAVIRTATNLEVIASGATGANQINAGFYTHDEIFSKLEAWWTSELAAARLWGTYRISISEWDGDLRTKIFATISAPTAAGYEFRMPRGVACLFGYSVTTNPSLATGHTLVSQTVVPTVEHTNPAPDPPLRMIVLRAFSSTVQFDWNRVALIDERGTFFNQHSYWPGAAPGASTDYDGWGIFIVDGKFLAFGNKNGAEIGALLPLAFQYTGVLGVNANELGAGSITDTIEIRQIMILEGPLFEVINRLFYSSGTTGYNHATYDTLPNGMGLAIPGELLGIEFEASVAALPGASSSTVVVIDEPTTLAEVFGGDFVLRRAFTLWKESHVKFGTWRAPTSGDAIHTLEEANKAEPAGTDSNDKHRSSTAQTSEWVRSVVKVDYNRDILAVGKDTSFKDSITFEDAAAVDDAGGRSKLLTIRARNTFGQHAATGIDINSIAPGFLSFLPMVSRPAWKIRRSIDCRHFEGLSVGDIVLFADEFARDPATGTRGISARPAIVTMHKWGIGGAQPDSDSSAPMGGEVELFFTDVNPTLQSAPYAPAADVDYTAITAGFDYGYSSSTTSLRCFTHHYSQTVDGLLNGSPIEIEDAYDASHFVAGHKIKIIERDPLDPTNPIIWERTVASQSGNDIVLTLGLSSPAWDNTRKYRVVFDDYDVIASAQQAWVFQADDADGLIQNTAQPYLYGSGTPPGAYEANPVQSASEHVELAPTIVQLEGAGRDVGYEKQLVRLVENIIDYKATCAPMLFNSVLSNTDYAAGYQLVAATPIFLTDEMLSGAVRRELSVAPMFRSSDGTTVYIRVSIYRNAPTAATLNDQSPGTVYDGAVWTTSSTTWQIPDPDILFAEIKNNLGLCWLQIECSHKCETRGLARFIEGPRST